MEIEPQVKQETEIVRPVKKKKVVVEPRLKPVPYKIQDIQSKTEILKTPASEVGGIQFYHNEEDPLNRRGFKYKPCKPNPMMKSTLYSTTDLPPYTVRPSFFDKATGIVFDESANKVTNSNGWRSVRTNVGVREGSWYLEFKIIKGNDEKSNDHVRLGFGRKEASLEAPIGYDGYGYAIRDINGQKVTLSKPENFMNEDFKTGDTIGMLIELPSLDEHYKALNEARSYNVVRDQIPIRYKSSLYFEQFEYTATESMVKLLNPIKLFGEKLSSFDETITLPKIPNSKITVYKNGKLVGPMFEDLYSFLPIAGNVSQNQNTNYKNTDDGTLGYFPVISIYNKAIVEFNPGPDFELKTLPEGANPLCERYQEFVAEQWYFDLLDEVENDYLDKLEAL